MLFYVWSNEYKTGKSKFLEYLHWLYKGRVLPGMKSFKHTLVAYDEHEVITFNLSRTSYLDRDMIDQLETLSDKTYVTCPMYEGRSFKVNAQIVVVANIPPPEILRDRVIEIYACTKKDVDDYLYSLDVNKSVRYERYEELRETTEREWAKKKMLKRKYEQDAGDDVGIKRFKGSYDNQ